MLVAAVAACDVPTGPPIVEQTWVVPGEQVTVSVGELLPAEVSLTADSSAFEITISGVSFGASLTEVCSACSGLHGQTVTKPAFSGSFASSVGLPSNVVSATVAGGDLIWDITHDFGFDPLRPVDSDPTVTGYAILTVTSGATVVARDSIDGADSDGAFASGTTKTITLPMRPVEIAGDLSLDVFIDSPEGDPFTVDTTASITVAMRPSLVQISAAEVQLPDVNIDTSPTTLDLAGVDSTVIKRVVDGAIRVNVDNPFAVGGTLTVTLDPPTQPAFQKSLTIQEGSYAQRLAFTGDELSAILGQDAVALTANGLISMTGSSIVVTPDRAIVMDTEIEVTVRVGGEEPR